MASSLVHTGSTRREGPKGGKIYTPSFIKKDFIGFCAPDPRGKTSFASRPPEI